MRVSGIVVVVLLLSLLALSVPASSEDWKQFRNDGRNSGGYSDDTAVEGWFYDTESPVRSEVVRINNTVYFVESEGFLRAIEEKRRDERWSLAVTGNRFESPVVEEGTVYFSSRNATVYALDDEGEIKWSRYTGAPIRSVATVADRVVYFGSGSSVYAVDSTDGELRWRVNTEGDSVASVVESDGIYAIVSHDDRNGPQLSSTLYSLEEGEINWTFEHPGLLQRPAISENRLFLTSQNGDIYALNSDGRVLWNSSVRSIDSSVSFYEGSVYMSDKQGRLYSVNATSGMLNWKFDLKGSASVGPSTVDGTIYVGNYNGDVHAVNSTTGVERWNFSIDDRLYSLTVVGNVVYLGTQGGVYAVSNETVSQLGLNRVDISSANEEDRGQDSVNESQSTQESEDFAESTTDTSTNGPEEGGKGGLIPLLTGILLTSLVAYVYFRYG